MAKLTVGQKLWYVPCQTVSPGKPREATVQAIGRRWATMDTCNRIDMDTLEADGGAYSPPGKCYLSKEAWEAERELEKAMWNFEAAVLSRQYGPGITTDAIYQAAALLGIELPKRGEVGNG